MKRLNKIILYNVKILFTQEVFMLRTVPICTQLREGELIKMFNYFFIFIWHLVLQSAILKYEQKYQYLYDRNIKYIYSTNICIYTKNKKMYLMQILIYNISINFLTDILCNVTHPKFSLIVSIQFVYFLLQLIHYISV